MAAAAPIEKLPWSPPVEPSPISIYEPSVTVILPKVTAPPVVEIRFFSELLNRTVLAAAGINVPAPDFVKLPLTLYDPTEVTATVVETARLLKLRLVIEALFVIITGVFVEILNVTVPSDAVKAAFAPTVIVCVTVNDDAVVTLFPDVLARARS